MKILKGSNRKRKSQLQGNPLQLSVDITTENVKTRSEWHDIFKVQKRKNLQYKILYHKYHLE